MSDFRWIFAGFGQKMCLPDGSWFKHPDSNKTWSNYTTCVDLDDLKVGAVKKISKFSVPAVGTLITHPPPPPLLLLLLLL